MQLGIKEQPTSEKIAGVEKLQPVRIWYSAFFWSLILFLWLNYVAVPHCINKNPILTKEEVLSLPYEKIKEGPLSWWLAKVFLQEDRPDIVLMGDSQINAGVFQSDAFTLAKALDTVKDRHALTLTQYLGDHTRQHYRITNLAMGGAMISDQYLIAQALLKQKPPKLVVLGINPRSFIDNSLPSASATEPFQFFEKYVDLGKLSHYAFGDQLGEINWYLKKNIPLLEMHDSVSNAISRATTQFLPARSTVRSVQLTKVPEALKAIYGAATDTKIGDNLVAPIVIPGFYDNTKEYLHRYKDPNVPTYKAEQKFFAAYLSSLAKLGTKVVVIGMPCMESNRQLLPTQFWADYRNRVANMCNQYGADWIDLSDDPTFTQPLFLDNVHVNVFGAKWLMSKLAVCLLNDPKAMKALQ